MKKSLVIALSLVSLTSAAAYAEGDVRINKGPRVMKQQTTRVVNYENQGRLYAGSDVDYTFNANGSSLTSNQGDRFNFGIHAGFKQPITDNFFVAAEFGPHWSTLHLSNLTGLKEQWGVDLLTKPGYSINDKFALQGLLGYRYSSFEQSTGLQDVSGNALVLGAGAEFMAADNFGIGIDYKHDFWFDNIVKNLGTDSLGMEINYYF